MLNLKEYQSYKYPFEKYLENIHAEDYHGTDDDMPDAFEAWITELEPEALIEYANTFTKFLLGLIKE